MSGLPGPSFVLLLKDPGKLVSPGPDRRPWLAGLSSAALLFWVLLAWAQQCSCDGHHLTQPVQAGWASQAASLSGRSGRHDGDLLRETGGRRKVGMGLEKGGPEAKENWGWKTVTLFSGRQECETSPRKNPSSTLSTHAKGPRCPHNEKQMAPWPEI